MSGKTLTWWACGLVAAAAVAAPSLALAGTGPYVGLEAGGNWVAGENYAPPPPGHQNKAVFGAIGGVVAGYSFADGLRPELEINYRWNELRSGKGLSSVPSGMANLWYDFALPGSWDVPKLHPYVGGGVGFGRIDPTLSSKFANAYRSVFLYQGGAGLDYDITNRLTASVGWRWIQSSKAAFAGPGTQRGYGRYRANSALLGVRYSFGAEAPTPVAAPVAPPPPPPPPPPPAKPTCNPPAGFQVDENCRIIPQKIILRSINFKFNKATLTDAAKSTLDKIAAAINKQPKLDVEIDGYTDSTGPAAYNKRLSQQRADSVRNYLIMEGVNGGNLTARGFGEADPVASNKTRTGRTLNRRVEFRVTNHVEHVKVKTAAPTRASVEAATP